MFGFKEKEKENIQAIRVLKRERICIYKAAVRYWIFFFFDK